MQSFLDTIKAETGFAAKVIDHLDEQEEFPHPCYGEGDSIIVSANDDYNETYEIQEWVERHSDAHGYECRGSFTGAEVIVRKIA